MSGKTVLIILVIVLVSLPVGLCKVIMVPEDSSSIQNAIDNSEDGDVILLADGVHDSGFHLYGKHRIIKSRFGPENCFLKNRAWYEEIRIRDDSRIILDGITFSDFNLNSDFTAIISIVDSDVSLHNCHFNNNVFSEIGHEDQPCLGIYDSDVSINRCSFNNNHSVDSRAGFGCVVSMENNADVTITESKFSGNSAGRCVHTSSSNLLIEGCEFSGNHTLDSGGAVYADSSELIIRKSRFLGNFSVYKGGAIYMTDMVGVILGGSSDAGNVFSGNQGSSPYGGNTLFYELAPYRERHYKPLINTRYNVFAETPSYYSLQPLTAFDFSHSEYPDTPLSHELFVAPEGHDENDGLTPQTALKTIRAATFKGYATWKTPLVIHLAPGVYSRTTNGETFPVYLFSNIVLNGSERDQVIVNAENTNSVIELYQGHSTRVEHLTVTGGRNLDGGGILIETPSDLTVSDCLISYNHAGSIGGGIGCFGGDLSCFDTVFFRNSSKSRGGGISHQYDRLNVNNCEFLENQSIETYGGGIDCRYSDLIQVTNSYFAHNSAYHDGGGMSLYNCPFLLHNCEFLSNSTRHFLGEGGGLRILQSDQNEPCSIFRCKFTDNRARSGGGLYACCEEQVPTILDCVFDGNQAEKYGGGLSINGSLKLINNLIINNSAYKGGGIFATESTAEIVNSTIADNHANYVGGVFCRDEGNISLVNSVIYRNEHKSIEAEDSAPTASFCDIQWGFEGPGNISEDPLFIAPSNSDYRLSHIATGAPGNSPCIDSGNGLPESATFSFAGLDRSLAKYTTRSDHVQDTNLTDMGYHYPIPGETLHPSVVLEMTPIIQSTKPFHLNARLFNPTDRVIEYPFSLLIKSGMTYSYWPDWSDKISYPILILEPGFTTLELLYIHKVGFVAHLKGTIIDAYAAFFQPDLNRFFDYTSSQSVFI